MGYSFMTLEKIKTNSQLVGKYKHNYREIAVANANPDKKDLNEELVSLDGKTYKQAFYDKLKSLGYAVDGNPGKKLRDNAVYAFEVVTTFSREDASHIDIEKWKENNVKWLREQFNANPEKYGDNVISVVYHADEPGNVHCHAVVVPIDDKGHLNARYYVQNRQKMISMQNTYGKLMEEEHGLKRGLPGSKANHKDIRKFYAALNQAIDNKLPQIGKNESLHEYTERINDIYQASVLKTHGLEQKLERSETEKETIEKTSISKGRKEVYEKYQDKIKDVDELEREFGAIPEVKEKCEAFDALLKGIENSEDKDDILTIVNTLILHGREVKKKENEKNTENLPR